MDGQREPGPPLVKKDGVVGREVRPLGIPGWVPRNPPLAFLVPGKRLGRPRQVPRRWQASLRQGLYPVVTGSVLIGFPSASLLVLSQLECPVSFFGAASTSAPPYKADPGHFRQLVFGRLAPCYLRDMGGYPVI